MGPDGPFTDPNFARLVEYVIVAAACICFCIGFLVGAKR